MDTDTLGFARCIEAHGYAITAPVLSSSRIAALRSDVATLVTDGRGGARNLLELPTVAALAIDPAIRGFVTAVLGKQAFAVRALLFDKTPTANWKVIWHQDLTIPTRAPADVPGYGPWTEKAGVAHVQPPVSVLAGMLAMRLHLDRSDSDNGPVCVLGGSHRQGRLSGPQIDALRASEAETECVVAEGGVLAFRPLLLHASAPARVPHHRRVIHIEYAAIELAPPLEWHRRVA
jgi:ectoine hydroxylase-related dioxygenase (phytanoyl-CoA dioxygenase family)